MPKQEKLARPKITIIPGRGVAQTINYLLEDRDDLEWIIRVEFERAQEHDNDNVGVLRGFGTRGGEEYRAAGP